MSAAAAMFRSPVGAGEGMAKGIGQTAKGEGR